MENRFQKSDMQIGRCQHGRAAGHSGAGAWFLLQRNIRSELDFSLYIKRRIDTHKSFLIN